MRSLLALSITFHVVTARLLHSLPEDTYAFPKYRVTFLNGLPVLNETAEKWLKDGLRGGELEFLDQPWKGENWQVPSSPKEIGSGNAQEAFSTFEPASGQAPSHSLEHMKIGPRNSYLCLIPKPLDSPPPSAEEESDAEVTPVRSWSLLQPLVGTCLYHRQGWFTYSYCHNEEIRQFKELIQVHPHSPGGYKPEEDPDWESYTLGRAPATPEPGADLTVAEQNAIAANLELARGAGSRYLVQRWGDGTICDKTGKKREVEVQFHCSMTMTDTILFVKEAKTCSYVLVIHTPRLCGEPGFKSPLDAHEEAFIRCREIVDSVKNVHGDLPEADHPFKLPRPKSVLSAAQPPAEDKSGAAGDGRQMGGNEKLNDMLRRALEAVVGGKALNGQDPQVFIERLSEDGQVFIEFIDDFHLDEGEDAAGGAARIANALRTAGFDIKGEKVVTKDGDKADKKADKKPAKKAVDTEGDPYRDEL